MLARRTAVAVPPPPVAPTLPAVVQHPVTGEAVWMNGIHTNHRDYFELAPHIDTSLGRCDTPYSHHIALLTMRFG